jgi:O-antigen/teichoic acid export membrane protein
MKKFNNNREMLLIKNTIIYALGNFGSKLLSFFLLPLYTYYLSTNDYGYFDIISTTITLCVPLISLQISDGIYRFLLDCKDGNEKTKIITNSVIILLVNVVTFSILYLIFVQFKDFKYQYMILIQIVVTIIYNVWSQVARGLKKNTEYSISGVLMTFFTVVSNLILLKVFNLKVSALILSYIISYVICIIYLESNIKILNNIYFRFVNKKHIKQLCLYSIPLIPNAVSWWFMSLSDRYILTYYQGVASNGIYAIANKLPAIIMVINSFFSLAWQDSSILEYKSSDKNKYYTKTFNYYMKIQFTILIILIAFTKFILRYLVDQRFYSAWAYVPFLYIATVFISFSVFYGAGYLSSRDTKGAFITTIFGATVNVVINLITIPYIGIQGASLSTMISCILLWLIRVKQTKKYFNININKFSLISLIIISGIYTYLYYFNNKYIEVCLMLFSIIIFIFYNKSILYNIKKIVFDKVIHRKIK